MLPEDSAARKQIPLASGVLFYFDAALVQVAYCGPLLYNDHADAIVGHLLFSGKGNNSAKMCKHALALLQKEIMAGYCRDHHAGLGDLFDVYADAFEEIANVSLIGSQKHHPGEPMFHERGKSMDHADCILRHRRQRGTKDKLGKRHSAYLAWRCLALYQQELEDQGAPLARNARFFP